MLYFCVKIQVISKIQVTLITINNLLIFEWFCSDIYFYDIHINKESKV